MNYDDLMGIWKTQYAVARALGVRQPSVSRWQHDGVPVLRQLQVEKLTRGRLRADDPVTAAVRERRRA